MNINNAKSVKIFGITYDIVETDEREKLRGDNDGLWSTTTGKIYLKKGLPRDRKSHVIWHEICHAIDFYNCIKKESAEFDEFEVQRIASGLQSLELVFNENEKE